ncbi:MAG: porin [Proteobacteria bacterium]|nr:porin [Pseudomonadota bacterium]
MKKSLLALAVLGAFAASAQAQTNVAIGGVVQANVKSYKVGGISAGNAALGRQGNNELRVDDDYNSRFWLTGSEDLGGGNSAIFYVENRLNTDQRQSTGLATGAGLADGDTWVGLKGAWGQVTVGKHSWLSVQGLLTEMQVGTGGLAAIPTSMLGTYSILNQAGAVTGAGATGVVPAPSFNTSGTAYLDITRRVNSITYRSPNFSGFSGVVGVSTASAGAEGTINNTNYYNDGREYYLQGTYFNGPFYVNLAYRNHTAEGRNGLDQKQIRLSGFYKINGFKIGLQYDRATNDLVVANASPAPVALTESSGSRTAWQIPVSYSFGNHTILASYTKAGNYGNVTDSGAKMITLGWDYALSKRTNVGVYYSKLSNDTYAAYQPFLAGTSFTGSGLAYGENATTFALGLKHTF